jgi:Asp-tRNA(Asn)/Glu-tRNA(Gln) amidotransferase A subunit family amidase
MDRRRFLGACAAAGLSPAFASALLRAQDEKKLRVSKEILAEAEKLIGVSFSDAERELMLEGLDEALDSYAHLREVPLANAVPPAFAFEPARGGELDGVAARERSRSRWRKVEAPALPGDLEELAFRPAIELAALLRARKVSSRELTEMYLERLRRFDPALLCVVSLLEERALETARRADDELARGRRRGPLHGVPYGVKDLIAVRGARTTWGARPYREQVIDEDAAVVRRLDAAGAVLLTKLSCGALAWGDVWFGGKTRNPWQLEQGSSGSSAGSAAATAAGLVGFSIGTETYGSIVSPSTRCGTTGLRPTFGRVSRDGCMTLCWSLDKIGPIARAVEDCALVLDAIHGATSDGGAPQRDPDVVTRPFAYDAQLDIRKLRVGYVESAFAEERDDKPMDEDVLAALRGLGVSLRPVSLPDVPATDMISVILTAEAGAAFDAFSRGDLDDQLVRQTVDAWPNVFRQARLVPAVEYVMANRIRTLALRGMSALWREVDIVVSPTFGGATLALTNLTGHPEIVLPAGFREDGTPVSITLIGGLFDEARALALARAYQEATGFHRRTPPLFGPRAPAPELPAAAVER